jgi:hypothetical protein
MINMNHLLNAITLRYPNLKSKTLLNNLARKSAKKSQMQIVDTLELIQKGP